MYSIYAGVDPAPNRLVTTLHLGNCGKSVEPSWLEACPQLDGLAGIDGRTAQDVSVQLLDGLRTLFRNRDDLRKTVRAGTEEFHNGFSYFARVTRTALDHPDAAFTVFD